MWDCWGCGREAQKIHDLDAMKCSGIHTSVMKLKSMENVFYADSFIVIVHYECVWANFLLPLNINFIWSVKQ